MNRFENLFKIYMEEVSTFLDSENKIKSGEDSESNNETEQTTNECCDAGRSRN